jgi:Ca-activated chloride channel homolog
MLAFLLANVPLLPGQDTSGKNKNSNPKKEKAGSKNSLPLETRANIFVSDENGKLITGLKAREFKIYEDGVEQEIAYFTQKDGPLNLGLVIDNSGSMRPYLDEIINAGMAITRSLKSSDSAFVLRFISRDKIDVTRDWTSDKPLLRDALENMFIEGGQSAVIDAVYAAAQKNA